MNTFQSETSYRQKRRLFTKFHYLTSTKTNSNVKKVPSGAAWLLSVNWKIIEFVSTFFEYAKIEIDLLALILWNSFQGVVM